MARQYAAICMCFALSMTGRCLMQTALDVSPAASGAPAAEAGAAGVRDAVAHALPRAAAGRRAPAAATDGVRCPLQLTLTLT